MIGIRSFTSRGMLFFGIIGWKKMILEEMIFDTQILLKCEKLAFLKEEITLAAGMVHDEYYWF